MFLFCVRSEQADSDRAITPHARPLPAPRGLTTRANGSRDARHGPTHTPQKALGGSLRDFGIYSVSRCPQNPLVALRDVNTLTGPSPALPASTPRSTLPRGVSAYGPSAHSTRLT